MPNIIFTSFMKRLKPEREGRPIRRRIQSMLYRRCTRWCTPRRSQRRPSTHSPRTRSAIRRDRFRPKRRDRWKSLSPSVSYGTGERQTDQKGGDTRDDDCQRSFRAETRKQFGDGGDRHIGQSELEGKRNERMWNGASLSLSLVLLASRDRGPKASERR